MMSEMLPRLSQSQLVPGDLLFFYSPVSHVSIYLGGELHDRRQPPRTRRRGADPHRVLGVTSTGAAGSAEACLPALLAGVCSARQRIEIRETPFRLRHQRIVVDLACGIPRLLQELRVPVRP